jgi:hypothetical protein
MAKVCVISQNITLRAGAPAVSVGCPSEVGDRSSFILQTFGVKKQEVITYKATTELLQSTDFVGMNPNAEFQSASYTATIYTDSDGDVVFQGTENKVPTYGDESELPSLEEVM